MPIPVASLLSLAPLLVGSPAGTAPATVATIGAAQTTAAPICEALPVDGLGPGDFDVGFSSGASRGGAGKVPVSMQAGQEGELPRASLQARAPGADTNLQMSWEPTIAVDPGNPRIVAAAQFTSLQVSFDGGSTFQPAITAPGVNRGGDPSVAFDSQGRLFITYLCSPGGGRDICITGYDCDPDTTTCAQLPGVNWPVNVAAAAGRGGFNADKEWLAADSFPGGGFSDRLYVVWTDLSTSPWSIWVTYSGDQGENWSAAQQLSAGDESKVWPSHVTVSRNGFVYVAYHSQTGFLDGNAQRVPDGVSGQIVVRRSENGGVNWQPRSFAFGPGEADMSWNVQHKANGVIAGAQYWLQGSSQPWVLADPDADERIYVVANDDPDDDIDSGDAADVFIAISDDFGVSWSDPVRVDNGQPGTFQVMPTAAIDPVTGAIAVTYYDNSSMVANPTGNFQLDLLATASFDGGLNWLPEVDVNDGLFDVDAAGTCRFCGADNVGNLACSDMACPAPRTTRIGEYNGIAFGECTAYMVWADDDPSNPPTDIDTFFDRDPELGGDFEPPELDCPANLAVGCNDPVDPESTGEAAATDQCDLDPAVDFVDLVLPGNCPPGVTLETVQRTWNATDAAGNIDTCEQLISVIDADPPEIMVPLPLELECNAPGGVPADDPAVQAWLDSAVAVDECTDAVLENNAPDLFPAGCPPDGLETPVVFSAQDQCGNSDFAVSSVTVIDTTSPEVSCEVAIDTLWPPNHKLIDVGFSFTAADLCDPEPLTLEVTVTSDESPDLAPGAGGPRHCADAVIGPDNSVLLRAERSGPGDGRVYVVTVTAADACGNAGACSAEVTVPKSQGPQGAAVDSGQLFDPTQCSVFSDGFESGDSEAWIGAID